jgi:Ankyrin repeat
MAAQQSSLRQGPSPAKSMYPFVATTLTAPQKAQLLQHCGESRLTAGALPGGMGSKDDTVGLRGTKPMNFFIPTQLDMEIHIHDAHGHHSWQCRYLSWLHSKPVKAALMLLLMADVLILFSESFLQAQYPPCRIIECDGISCCDDPFLAVSPGGRWLQTRTILSAAVDNTHKFEENATEYENNHIELEYKKTGQILDQIDAKYSRDSDGNTALHHAAFHGNWNVTKQLFKQNALLMHCASSTTWELEDRVSSLKFGTTYGVACLLAGESNHGDSPLMMAAAAGHVAFCLLALEMMRSTDETGDRRLIEHKNQDGNSFFSIVYGHGRTDLLHSLLEHGLVTVTEQDVQRCRKVTQRALALTKSLTSNQETAEGLQDATKKRCQLLDMELKELQYASKKCCQLLETELTRLADLRMEQLLQELDEEKHPAGKSIPFSRKVKKKKLKKEPPKSPVVPVPDEMPSELEDSGVRLRKHRWGLSTLLTMLSSPSANHLIPLQASTGSSLPLVQLRL